MINGDVLKGVVDQVIDLFVPLTNNASVVQVSGGTANAYGEKIGQSEIPTGFQMLQVTQDDRNRTTGAGDTNPKDINFIAKSTVTFGEGDRIRYDGNDYTVTFVERIKVSGVQVYQEGVMVKIHGN